MALAGKTTAKELAITGNQQHPCPACGSAAVADVEIETEWDGEEQQFTGAFTREFTCYFCGLHLTNFDQIYALRL